MTGRAQEWQNGVTAVQPDAVGEQEADFFGELEEAGGRVAGSSDEDFRVDDAGEVRVFIIELGSLIGGGGVGFVVLEVFTKLGVVGDVFGEWLESC